MKRNLSIDLIRIIAVFFVFYTHLFYFMEQAGYDMGAYSKKCFLLWGPGWGSVWTFLILSGFLTGKGFAEGRNTLDRSGIIRFYLSRFIKIGLPMYFFVFICCLLVYPGYAKEQPGAILRILTFTFNGEGGVNGIGATWYVCLLMQLYVITPFAIYLIEKVKDHSRLICAILLALGLVLRWVLFLYDCDWYTLVYTFAPANLDLFFAGALINYFPAPEESKRKDMLSWLFFIFVLVFTSLLNYRGNIFDIKSMFLFQYGFPTVFVIAVGWILYRSGIAEKEGGTVISWFADISFQFYLWHSLVLSIIQGNMQGGQNVVVAFAGMLFLSLIFTIVLSAYFTVANKELLRPLLTRVNKIA